MNVEDLNRLVERLEYLQTLLEEDADRQIAADAATVIRRMAGKAERVPALVMPLKALEALPEGTVLYEEFRCGSEPTTLEPVLKVDGCRENTIDGPVTVTEHMTLPREGFQYRYWMGRPTARERAETPWIGKEEQA